MTDQPQAVAPQDAAPQDTAPAAKKRSGGLNSMLIADLKSMAAGLGVAGAGSMKKAQLVEAIKAAQDSWREKMTEFITHLIKERFRNTETLSAQDWEAKEERFFFVYEQMDVEGTIDTFAWFVADKDLHREDHDESDEASDQRFQAARAKIAEAFACVSARQGFKAAQPLLPENRRYNFISKIVGEFPADIYLKPENEDDYDDIFED